jgi:two-component system, NarL family, invasion response regulator UvrY
MIQILIADDHTVVRKGLIQILLDEFPSARIEEVDNAEDLIKKSIHAKWDVIITDLTMPGRSGLDALHQLSQFFSKMPVLVMSIHPEELYAIRALKAGAAGYLSKNTAADELVKAVRLVLAGKKYISPAMAENLANSIARDHSKLPHEQLSDREFDVLKLLAAGKSVSEIASSLSLSVTTVSTYRARIMNKMNMKSNAELTMYALENKLM